MSSGLILGKFMPPHRGHKYLIDFGRAYVDDLTVHVCSIPSEPIPGHLRYRWVRDSFGGVRVVHNDDLNPQEPAECPDRFWDIWRESLLSRMPAAPDYVFASEPYGFPLAETLGATYVPVDHMRELVPISGTTIRSRPMRYWDAILPAAQSYFALKIALVGPESSGKSTLTANLAVHYQTRYVSEYARGYLETVGPDVTADAIIAIAKGHRASEEAMAMQCNRVLFIDTESIVTRLWSNIYVGHVPELVDKYIQDVRYDLYLVTSATEIWVDDSSRIQPEYADRQAFAADCIATLESLGRPYLVLQGDWAQRQAEATAAIDALLKEE